MTNSIRVRAALVTLGAGVLPRLLPGLTWGAVGVVAILGASGLSQPETPSPGPSSSAPHAVAQSALARDRIEMLFNRHRCWSGSAPESSPIPSRAIVTLPGQPPKAVPADVGFGIWLDGDPGTLHGFCP